MNVDTKTFHVFGHPLWFNPLLVIVFCGHIGALLIGIQGNYRLAEYIFMVSVIAPLILWSMYIVYRYRVELFAALKRM